MEQSPKDSVLGDSGGKSSFASLTTEDLISVDDIVTLGQLKVKEASMRLAELLHIDEPEWDMKSAIYLQYYAHGFVWAKDNFDDPKKIAKFLNIMDTLMKNLLVSKLTIKENLLELKAVVKDECGKIFTLEDVQRLVKYMSTTFFQHYKLYQYAETHDQYEIKIHHKVVIEVPPNSDSYPPPLEEALEKSEFAKRFSEPNYPPTYVASHRGLNAKDSFLMSVIHGN